MNIVSVLDPIWVRLIKKNFDSLMLARAMIKDGGLDMEPLTEADLVNLVEGKFNGDWGRVVFSFSELLNYYANLELDDYQVIAWCFAVLVVGEAARKGKTDWELRLASVARGFDQATRILQYQEFTLILKVAFTPRNLSIENQ
jgi:hypothetical protein